MSYLSDLFRCEECREIVDASTQSKSDPDLCVYCAGEESLEDLREWAADEKYHYLKENPW